LGPTADSPLPTADTFLAEVLTATFSVFLQGIPHHTYNLFFCKREKTIWWTYMGRKAHITGLPIYGFELPQTIGTHYSLLLIT
jgi:hypothetical protein